MAWSSFVARCSGGAHPPVPDLEGATRRRGWRRGRQGRGALPPLLSQNGTAIPQRRSGHGVGGTAIQDGTAISRRHSGHRADGPSYSAAPATGTTARPSPGAAAIPPRRTSHATNGTAIPWRRSSHEANDTAIPQRRTSRRPPQTRPGRAPATKNRQGRRSVRRVCRERTNPLVAQRAQTNQTPLVQGQSRLDTSWTRRQGHSQRPS